MNDDYLMLASAGVSETFGLGVAFSCRTRDLSTFDFFFFRCSVLGFIWIERGPADVDAFLSAELTRFVADFLVELLPRDPRFCVDCVAAKDAACF